MPPRVNNVSALAETLFTLFLPCKTWSAHREHATIELLQKLQNLSHLNCGIQICKIWFQLITVRGDFCMRRCTKFASLIWTNWNSDWERNGLTRSCRYFGSHSSVMSSVARDQWCLFCTPFHAIFLKWIQIWPIIATLHGVGSIRRKAEV